MALQDLLDLSTSRKKIGLSEERVRAVLPIVRQYAAFWREYPDLFVDFMVRGNNEPKDGEFKFYFYQRVFLRSVMRFQYVYAVFPRAYSKSFLTVMALMIRCILYPGAHLFVTSGGKEQGASILSSKVQEICRLIPSFEREIDWRRGQTQEGKDRVVYKFKNGSQLDNLAARESTRGQRRHGGSMEECVGIDDAILREVIIPVMAVSRRARDGTVNEKEPLNKSQIYITTAGYKGTYPYDRLIGFLVRMVTQPDRCMVLGGTWRTPVAVGLQSKTFITDQKNEGTYNEASFEREYESKWSGTVEDAFFNGEFFAQQARSRCVCSAAAAAYGSRSNRVAVANCIVFCCGTICCKNFFFFKNKSVILSVKRSNTHNGNQNLNQESLQWKKKTVRRKSLILLSIPPLKKRLPAVSDVFQNPWINGSLRSLSSLL